MTDKIEDKTPQDFIKAYEALCKEYRYSLSITPMWIARDDGTWSTKLEVRVGKLSKES